MKLGVMAAEGDVATNSGSDYLAVQNLMQILQFITRPII
jgi:hypothetical protein